MTSTPLLCSSAANISQMDQASSNCCRIKACYWMLRSNAFATSNYRKNCRTYERKFNKLKLEADHIIDLDLVSSCFCEAFLHNSLEDCLEVRKMLMSFSVTS